MSRRLAIFAALSLLACGPSSATEGGGTETTGESESGNDGYEPFPAPCSDPGGSAPCAFEDPAACGNGVLDSCEVCGSSDDGPVMCMDVTEACDGLELGGASCESLGYVSGALRCSQLCQIDLRDCESCVAPSDRATCTRPRVDALRIGSLALASDGEGVGAAWIGDDQALHFARFDANLQLLGARDCEQDLGFSVSLAASSGGWVIAAATGGDNPETTLILLDAEGMEQSRTSVANAAFPKLLTRPGGEPALVYASTDFAGAPETPIHLRSLDAAGESEWDVEAFAAALPEASAAAYLDPGVLVGGRGPGAPVQLVPVDASGVVGAPVELDVAGTELELASAEPGVAVAYWSGSMGHRYARIDEGGGVIGEIVELGPPDPSVATQARTLSVAGGRSVLGIVEDLRTSLAMTHLDAGGGVAVPAYDLALETQEIGSLASVSLADEVVLAYSTYGAGPETSRLVFARVTP
jgi:hypothetical protein